jgi:hypothetical protein
MGVVLDSGRIVHEDIVGDPYSEDLKTLKNSPLGQAVLQGVEADLAIEGTVLYRNGQPTEEGRFLRKMLGRI